MDPGIWYKDVDADTTDILTIYGYIGYVRKVSTHILFDFLEPYFKYLFVMFFWQEGLERPAGLNEQLGWNDFF